MKVDTSLLVPMAEANQNFSKVVRTVDEKGMAVILKNNKPKYVVIDFDSYDVIQSFLEDFPIVSPLYVKDKEDKKAEVTGADPHLIRAVELITEKGTVSSSLLQRKLNIGFMKASKILDKLEELGYISGPNGSKPRAVLIKSEDVAEIIEKLESEGVALQ